MLSVICLEINFKVFIVTGSISNSEVAISSFNSHLISSIKKLMARLCTSGKFIGDPLSFKLRFVAIR